MLLNRFLILLLIDLKRQKMCPFMNNGPQQNQLFVQMSIYHKLFCGFQCQFI